MIVANQAVLLGSQAHGQIAGAHEIVHVAVAVLCRRRGQITQGYSA